MRSGAFLSLSFGAGVLAVAFAAPASATILVNIDKDTQRMTVTVDGAQRYVWPVSTGRAGYDTPSGTFRPNRMDADHLSQEWDNAPMPHTIFFDLHGHAIHGFNDTRRIGSPASHGCVRLAPQNAATLYALVEAQGMKDTTVVVSGHTPTGSEIARRGGVPVADPAAGPPVEIAPAQPPASDRQEAVAYGQQPPPTLFGLPLFGGPEQPAAAPPGPPQQRTGFFGQPPQPPPYGQQSYGQQSYAQQPYAQQPYGQQPGYVRSSDGRVYYVQPGSQQPYVRQY